MCSRQHKIENQTCEQYCKSLSDKHPDKVLPYNAIEDMDGNCCCSANSKSFPLDSSKYNELKALKDIRKRCVPCQDKKSSGEPVKAMPCSFEPDNQIRCAYDLKLALPNEFLETTTAVENKISNNITKELLLRAGIIFAIIVFTILIIILLVTMKRRFRA